jgi:hypothetical protein
VAIPAQTNPIYASVVGGVTLSWGTTDRLIFQSPLAAVASGTDALVSFNTTDYYTKTQVDAAIVTAIAAIGGPIYSWPTGTILYFNGSVSPSIQVNPSVTNQTGSAISIPTLSTTTWTISFDWNISTSQVFNHYVFAVNGVISYNETTSGYAFLNGTTGSQTSSSPAIVNGTRQAIKFVFDQAVDLKFYVDTVLVGTLSNSVVSMSGYLGKLTISEDVSGGYDTVGSFRNLSVTNSVI